MYRYIIEDLRHIPPFNEEASELTVGTVALKIHQENVFTALFGDESKLGNIFKDADGRQTHNAMQTIDKGPAVLYRDNLWFDREFMEYFINEAKKAGKACRAAFWADDAAFRTYALPLTKGFERVQ